MEEFGLGYVAVAYGLIWLFFFGYILYLSIRIGRLEKELSNHSK